MKTYRFDIKVTGFMTVEIKAKSNKKAEEKALDEFDKFLARKEAIDKLQYIRLDTQLLTIDGKDI